MKSKGFSWETCRWLPESQEKKPVNASENPDYKQIINPDLKPRFKTFVEKGEEGG